METLIDARDMQPPEPFEATMAALEVLQPGDEIVLWLGRYPEPLFNVLRRHGFVWTEHTGPDECFEFRIRHAA